MIINNKKLEPIKVKQLITSIKEKRELRDLDDNFVKEELKRYFLRNNKTFLVIKETKERLNTKSTAYKLIVKEVRAKLRRSYGLFRTEKDFLKEKDFDKILNLHSSTKERLNFYHKLYDKIFKITGKPKTILDLGAGVNPLSYNYLKTNLEYYAYDLSKEEVKIINRFFKEKKIKGNAKILDLLNINKIKQLPKVDLAFLFKMTDVLDKGKGHKTSEDIIKAIPTKHVVVSFPTLTISGKPMNHPRRGWIEMMCKRLNYNFKVLTFENEIFYVIKINK
jgi:hypothetical protein